MIIKFWRFDNKYRLRCVKIFCLYLEEKGLSVAFSAILSKDTTVGGKEVVKYDSVLTNVGGAYQPSTGVFTAPYKGIYTISCSLMSHPSNSVHLDIMKNGKKLSIVYSASGTNPHSAQTLQLLLNKGDRVWIQNRSGNKASLHDHGSYNLFSGALITKVWNKGRWNVIFILNYKRAWCLSPLFDCIDRCEPYKDVEKYQNMDFFTYYLFDKQIIQCIIKLKVIWWLIYLPPSLLSLSYKLNCSSCTRRQ